MLLQFLTARLGNREEAEDALQDMWLRIDQLTSYPVSDPVAFLYRVAANMATDRRIAAGRRLRRDRAWQDQRPLADDFPDAERSLIARNQLRQVEAAIADMPERMATALRLFRLEGVSQRAIADRLGISVSGVEKLLQRAYRKIEEGLGQVDADLANARRLREEGSAGHAH